MGKLHARSRKLARHRTAEWLEPRTLLSVNVLTWHNDLTRQGQNTAEAVLTPSNVNAGSFGKLFSYPVQGQVYAQPLYVSNLPIPGQGTHNVVFVVTQNNDVYAFDADGNSGPNGGLLWHVNMGLAATMPNSFFGNRYGPYHDINPQVGITSTPVIDLASNTMYIDAFTNDIAGQNAYSHHIHALDLTTGADKMTPMLVSASVNGNGVGGNGTTIPFVATQQLQRPALTLLNGVLYVCYSGFADTDPYHGWILGFNPSNLQLVSVLNTTPNADTDANEGEGGIWMTGAGPASDGTNLFLLVANGDFNAAVGDYGDSILRVAPDPASTQASPNINGYGLKVADYFTPLNEQSLADADADLGSGGGLILPDQAGAHPHEFVGGGKQGVIYVVDRDNLGHFNAGTDNVVQKVSVGHGFFNSPAYFNGAVYYHAVGDVLKKYTVTNGMLSAAPAAQSSIVYSSQGAVPSISSSGAANGIVWDVQWDSTHEVLHAYDAGSLVELYNSNQNAARDQLGVGVKFITPTIADGHVFVGSASALTVYGGVAPPTSPPAAPTNLIATSMGASAISLNWIRNSDNESGFKIERSTDNVNFAQINIASAGSLSYSDTSVSPSTTYYYRVRATNIIGDSVYTNTASATTSTGTDPTDLYRFDEGSGTMTADSTGANTGTLIGTTKPTWILPGKTGAAALSFNGDGVYKSTSSQSAVQVNNLATVLGGTATLTAWIKTTQSNTNSGPALWNAPAIAGVEVAGSSNDIRWGYLDPTGHIGVGAGNTGLVSTSAVNNGQWHHVAFTRDAATGMVQIFVDGALQTSGTSETGIKSAPFRLIGAQVDLASDGSTTQGNTFFNGQLDEVRIYNQVLSAHEVAGMAIVPGAPTLTSAIANPGPVVHLAWTTPSSFTQAIEVDRKIGAGGAYTVIATLGGGATSFDDTDIVRGTTYSYVIKAIDLAGTSPSSNQLSITPPVPTIAGRSIFYNGSSFDGQNGSSNLTDTTAVASDKLPLLPGQTATFANYTSYSKGINGIIIDVANLDNLPRYEDFNFRVGNDNNPANWAMAPVLPLLVNDYPGRGPGGSTQITIIWPDNAIQNQWLQLTVLANEHTGLAANDVFYFGNAIGDTGNSATDANVNSSDVLGARGHHAGPSAPMTNVYDFNRDQMVDAADVAIAVQNVSSGAAALQLITAPALGSGSSAGEAISVESTTSIDAPTPGTLSGTADRRTVGLNFDVEFPRSGWPLATSAVNDKIGSKHLRSFIAAMEFDWRWEKNRIVSTNSRETLSGARDEILRDWDRWEALISDFHLSSASHLGFKAHNRLHNIAR